MAENNDKTNTVRDQDAKAVCLNVLSDHDDMFDCVRSSSPTVLHYHDCVEIIQSQSDGLTVTVGNSVYSLDFEDCIIILPGEQHMVGPENGDKAYIVIDFDQNFVFSSALASDDLRYIFPSDSMRVFRIKDNFSFMNKHTLLAEYNAHIIAGIPSTMVDECEQQKRFYRLAVRSHLAFLSLVFLRQWEEADAIANGRAVDKAGISRIGKVLENVDNHYMEDITSEDMAGLAEMSYSYFSRFFKNTMKVTFSEYLNRKRIEEGEVLLRDTNIPIAEIAERVGYSNSSYFISQFKKHRMMTPKKYRLRYGEK